MILSGFWNTTYFRIGIPIFKYKLPRNSPSRLPKTNEAIARKLPSSIFPPIRVYKLATDEFAFREALWPMSYKITYTPIMRGSLKYFRDEVQVTGLINWSAIIFFMIFASIPLTSGEGRLDLWMVPLFLCIIEGSIYAIQVKRYMKVAEIAAQKTSRY